MSPAESFESDVPQGWLPPPSEPGVISSFRGWHLNRLLGLGGMGVVFLARSEQTPSEQVAIKVLRPELQTNGYAVAKFQKEMRLASRMDHPNIIRARQVEEVFGLYYFIMPYLEGGNLTEYIQQKPLSHASIRELMVQMADALAYCHARGIIHRDVKPTNILFDKKGHSYLTDFGLATTAASDSFVDPKTTKPRGTAAYLSPKMANGEVDDTRGDIYSLGAVLYEILAGQPPYSGPDVETILQKIKQGPPRPIHELNPKAEPHLANIAGKAMARDLKDRYVEIGEMVADLRNASTSRLDSKEMQSFHSTKRHSHPKRAQSYRMRLWAVIIILICCLIPLLVHHFKPKFILSEETPPLANTPWHGGKIGWWSLDGSPQIIHYANHDGKLTILNEDGTLYSTSQIPASEYDKFQMLQASDVLGDSRDELIFRWNKGNNAGISIFNQGPMERITISLPGSEVLTFDSLEFQKILESRQQLGEDTAGKEQSIFDEVLANRMPYRNEIQWHGVHDLDLDGREEALISLNTGYELSPRKLVCVDMETRNINWEQSSGPMLRKAHVLSRAEQKKPALIAVVGDAPNNGAIGPDGITDTFSHLYLFDGLGNRLWSRQIAYVSGTYGRTKIGYLNNMDDPVVIAVTTRPSYNNIGKAAGSVLLFDVHGDLIKQRQFNHALAEQFLVGNHPEDESQNVIGIMTNDATFHILDHQLNSIRTVFLGENHEVEYLTEVITLDDLNGDHQMEWLLMTFENKAISEFNGKGLSESPTEFQRGNIKLSVVSEHGKLEAQELIHRNWNHKFHFSVVVTDNGNTLPRTIYFMGHNLKKYQYR